MMLYYNKLMFLQEMRLIKHVHQNNVIFVTIGIFQISGLSFNQMPTKAVMAY